MSSQRSFGSPMTCKRSLYHRYFTRELFVALILCLTAPRSSVAFRPSPPQLVTFRTGLLGSQRRQKRLYAQEKKEAGGVPQYDKIDMVLVNSESVAEGSQLWTMEPKQPKDEAQIDDYQAGHVLAVEMEAPDDLSDGHTKEDATRNGGWMRGPYTLTRCKRQKQLQILFKVVGEKTRAMAKAKPGTPLRIGGKFQTPIVQGILQAAAGKAGDNDRLQQQPTRRVVLISTGVGVGPCIGAVEEYLGQRQKSSITNLHLVASFRTQTEVVDSSHLNDLSEQSQGLFTWTPVITSTDGRLSDSAENLRKFGVTLSNAACGLSETHYHLIGNGQLVQEWQQGLQQANVPKNRITTEIYFNHRAEQDAHRVAQIASAIRAASAVSAEAAKP
eukprot:scaffold4214_cov172-Amphora_coffeaeformis.AAC.1